MTTAPKPTGKTTITATEFNAVKHRLAELNVKIEELRRKSRGTTEANARVAGLEAQVKAITAQLKLNGDRFNLADDPAVKEAVSEEIARLNRRIEEFNSDVNTQLKELRTTVEEHTGLLAEHGTVLGEHGTRLGMVEEGQTSLHKRVELIATTTEPTRIPLLWFIVAAFVGLVAGVIWDVYPFSDSITLADKQVITIPYFAANSHWAALLVGIAAAAITLGLLLIFTGGRRTSNTEITTTRRDEVTTTPPPQVVQARTTTVPPEPAANPTPTEVFQRRTEPGVAGARS